MTKSGGSQRPASAARESSFPLIVGVGASAGGLVAFCELLQAIGDAPGIAFVFVQHLAPTKKSLLADLLSDNRSIKVVEVTGRRKIKPNTVYICPPQSLLELKNGWVRVVANENEERPANPIDHFFHSMAEDQVEHGVGVILSGAGSDGTLGLKAISDCGGLTFAQDPASAKYDTMPRSAATTGVADHVMPPAEIAAELIRYQQHLSGLKKESSTERLKEQIEEAIPQIAKLLDSATEHNFKHYKTKTLIRRITRRLHVLKIDSVNQYVEHLREHDDEAQALFRELLIGVTSFFRDPEVFEAVSKQVLPKLLERRSVDNNIRIWIAGCANGSEAYTVAILCREAMSELKSAPKVQIFATDIDRRALQIARTGSYPIGIAEDVSPERLKRFFIKRGNRYHVGKEIRDLVTFSTHNLISDPPFSRQDLICCRNLLIYLGPHLQNKLIPLFHYSLRPSGYLLLGPSEDISSHGELFRPLEAASDLTAQRNSSFHVYRNAVSARHNRAE